jgi:carbon-monoxide dehydrogenase large subunit
MALPSTFGIGARQPRLEDRALLTGEARYVADIAVEGMAHVAFVRSMFAHARIAAVDVAAALAADGVVAVLTAADLGLGPVYYPDMAPLYRSDAYHRIPLAADTVRFVGDIVAVVVAETPAAAEDAAELVLVEYDPLPTVVDPVAAAADGAQLLFPETGTNVAVDIPFESGERSPGDTVAVSAVIGNHRMAVAPMEGNAIAAVPDPATGRITAYVSTQLPHGLRDVCAQFLGIDPGDLHLVTGAVGGGFGGKTPLDPEYVTVLAAARHLGRPLRWVQTRNENLLTMHARGHRFEVTLRATPDGRVTSMEVDALTDAGAYPGIGCGMSMTARALATGAYRIPHVRFDARCVATNTAPMGSFRGAGRPEAIALLERTMDLLAGELELDPVELRRRNLIRPEDFPYRSATGFEYDTGEYERALDEALRHAGYAELRSEQARRRERGDTRHLGIGISCYVEMSAAGRFASEYASVEVTPDGGARVVAGTSAHGQGHHTTYAQIVASVLGIPVERISFLDGDTDLVPAGEGTGGSRSAQVGGSAVKVASEAVLEKGRLVAAGLLEASAADIVVGEGGLCVQGVPTSTLSWATLAEAASDPARLPPGMEPGLSADPGFEQSEFGTAPFGCHVAVVEVDGETGAVELLRIVAVDDCGTVINPLLAEGQVHGGLLAGIGQALFEEVTYDEEGNPLNASFADYAFPSAAELPSFETHHTVTPTPRNPLGAKGLGEAGTTGSLAAVHNAVVDAVSHLGIRHIELPLTPQNVWAALEAAAV